MNTKWLNIAFILVVAAAIVYKLINNQSFSTISLTIALFLILTNIVALFRKNPTRET
ncbi:hypothetical protein [Niallia sp. NCCP-28]|uniref:hypothetical protein n=1 Tax=Niallia sp. NCCP-28 TaxID=2934712 RepID=UPI00208D8227|nr:hypothetical protein [Niallia sp. NCCP-28]GKU84908.1 hypothetical protein NCCP28_43040 [Niallia sp. NCCP-28]